MKLSAPPPPPPPPGDENPAGGAPGSPEDPNSAAPANTPGSPEGAPAPAPEAGATESPPADATAAPTPKPLRWPSWYAGVDSTLAAPVLLLAFVSASFVARNSDVWLHLATGKRLFAGEYFPGSDPFSYSAADRTWVNHSWLADAFAYLLYGGEGKLLVAAKALVVALAFGLVLAIRRPQFALWPWAAVTGAAVLAAAPQFLLRPLVVSMLFLAVTLFLLFRMPRTGNPWRFPGAIGITFWLWANSDQWFFLGPLALALALVGELIQTYAMKAPEEPAAEADEPLGALPDIPTLAKALGIGVLACTLTPHHVGVWTQLPFELVGAEGAKADPRLHQLLITPYHDTYYSNPGWGYNLNGLAYAVLFAGGAAALGFGFGRLRASHVALWVGFAALSLLSVYAIPFFALVAVPLVAAQLNAFSARVELKGWGDPKSRLLWIGSSVGRIACVLAAAALCVIAYPGWVHPDPGHPAYARRVAWGVEPDPLLVKAAGRLQEWRENEKLPPEARGVLTNADFANYVAWYAPREKVFVNSRYNHHRPELPDFVALRKGLGLFRVKDEPPNPKDATEVLAKLGADYVALSSSTGEGFSSRAMEAASVLYANSDRWSPWYVDGQTTVFGWRPEGAKGKPEFAALRVDPVVLAFGPGVESLPEPELKQPLKELDWEGAFVRPLRPAPPGVAEALAWMRFKDGPTIRMARRQIAREGMVWPLALTQQTVAAPQWLQSALGSAESRGLIRVPPSDPDVASDEAAMMAAPILALRAARRAILTDPDHPEPYFALAEVLKDPQLPLTESERTLGRIVAYRQCLIRMPSPERYRRGQYNIRAMEVAYQLAGVYLGGRIGRVDPRSGQEVVTGFTGMPIDVAPLNQLLGQAIFEDSRGNILRVPFPSLGAFRPPPNVRLLSGNNAFFLPADVARETLQLALKYAPEDTGADPPDAAKERVRRVESLLTEAEKEVVRATQQYDQVKARSPKLPDLVFSAQAVSLPGEAVKLLAEADLSKEYGGREPYAVVLTVALELALGRIENTHELLTRLSSPENAAAFERAGVTTLVQALKYQKSLHAGEYRAAGEVLESMEGKVIGVEALVAELARNKIGPTELVFAALTSTPPPTIGAALLPALVFQGALAERGTRALQARETIANKLRQDAGFFYHRGMLSLLEGDIPAARRRFQQSTRRPPDGWALPNIAHQNANDYLRLIELAERRSLSP